MTSYAPNAPSDYNAEIFETSSLEDAMSIILTPEDGQTSGERWRAETPIIAADVARALELSPGMTVIDYGCGVGRVSKEIIQQTGCFLLGLDFSKSMRAFSQFYVGHPNFLSMAHEGLEHLIAKGVQIDSAFTVYVLQHCPDPAADIDLLWRALRPGGKLFVVEQHSQILPLTQGWTRNTTNVLELLGQRFGPGQDFALTQGAVTDLAIKSVGCKLYTKTKD